MGHVHDAAVGVATQLWQVTFVYSSMSIPLGVTTSLAVAMLMHQKIRGISLFRTIYYLPSVTSGVAVALLWLWMFNPEFGLINWMLSLIGIHGPAWVYSKDWALPAFVLMSLWGIGGNMIIYLAALDGVPTALYEAATLDGAGEVRQFLSVTLPMITPVLLFNLIMSIISSFQVFTSSYVMTAGGPAYATLFYVLYLYQNAFKYFRFGVASAMSWILFIIILVLTLLVLKSSSVWVYYEGERRK
jgi:multiple sugar transport system permease protein